MTSEVRLGVPFTPLAAEVNTICFFQNKVIILRFEILFPDWSHDLNIMIMLVLVINLLS